MGLTLGPGFQALSPSPFKLYRNQRIDLKNEMGTVSDIFKDTRNETENEIEAFRFFEVGDKNLNERKKSYSNSD